MTNKTTLFDIMQAAATTANSCIDPQTNKRKDDLTVASLKLEGFNSAGFDREDFAAFANNVENCINRFIVWRDTPSPATQAAASNPS